MLTVVVSSVQSVGIREAAIKHQIVSAAFATAIIFVQVSVWPKGI